MFKQLNKIELVGLIANKDQKGLLAYAKLMTATQNINNPIIVSTCCASHLDKCPLRIDRFDVNLLLQVNLGNHKKSQIL